MAGRARVYSWISACARARNALIRLPNRPALTGPPGISIAVTVVGNIGVIPDIRVVVDMNVRTAIPPTIPIGMTIVWVPIEAVMEHVQVIRMPANRECSSNTPEVVVVEMIAE